MKSRLEANEAPHLPRKRITMVPNPKVLPGMAWLSITKFLKRTALLSAHVRHAVDAQG
jgi:hypothetical protein